MAWNEWCEDPSSRQSSVEYEDNEERIDGFVPGTAIHSKSVNSALHELSLITAALGNAIAPDESIDTPLSELSTLITQFLNASIVNVQWSSGYLIFTKKDGTSFQIQIPTQRGTSMDNPMSAIGDLIIGGQGGTPIKMPVGEEGDSLNIETGVPSWGPTKAKKVKISNSTYDISRKALTITENGESTTYYVACLEEES